MKIIVTKKNILLGILFIFIDFILYVFLGLMVLDYEDFYDESQGAYWSLGSMTIVQKISYISFQTLIILNWVFVYFILFKLIKYFINKRKVKNN